MQTRSFGNTNDRLSVIGFGGIVLADASAAEASRHVGQAIDRGVNYFDVAPTYGDAEERLGPALKPYRDHAFLACKTIQRNAENARTELERSLQRLHTNHLDLYQIHGIRSTAEADQVLAPGGALHAFINAKDKGLVRYIGFSAHCETAAQQLLDAFAFDSVLFPINYACWNLGQFGPALTEKAHQRGTALLALKALAKRPWHDGEPRKWPKCWYAPVDQLADARAAIAFTLSKPVTAALSPGHVELLWLACDALETLRNDPVDETTVQIDNAEPIFRTQTDT